MHYTKSRGDNMDKNSNAKQNKFLAKAMAYVLAIGVILYGTKMLGESIRQNPIYILIALLIIGSIVFVRLKGKE